MLLGMERILRSLSAIALLLIALPMVAARHEVSAQSAGSGDPAYAKVAHDLLEDHYKRHPSQATDLGIHQYDDQIEDLSQAAIAAQSAALKEFRTKLSA